MAGSCVKNPGRRNHDGHWHGTQIPARSGRRAQANRLRLAHHAIAAMAAEQGMVSIHASTILPATPQRTADTECAEPTPTMAPVMVWVVDSGMPRPVARNRVSAPPDSAQNPSTGLSLV